MHNNSIEKLIEDTINSFDAAERAQAKPFLLTRINARIQSQSGTQNIWTRAGLFLSTPSVALTVLALIIILNVSILLQRSGTDNSMVQNTTTLKDEFAINVISIYDIENQEP